MPPKPPKPPKHLGIARRMARLAPALAVCATLAGPAAAAADGQNLVVNPGFDTDLSGWDVVGPATWDGTLDATGSPHSGSVRGVFNASAVNGDDGVVLQCVPLTVGVTYVFGGQVYVHPGNSATGSAFYVLIPFPTADCSGPPPPGPFGTTPPVTAAGSWIGSTATFTNTFARSAEIGPFLGPTSGGTYRANFDDVVVAQGTATCIPDPHTLCLQGSRFSVTAAFDTGGTPSSAQAVPIGNSGYFWFFAAADVEVLVKVLDGCGLNDRFWFFAAGLTNVHVAITVADTQTGASQVYTNPLNTAFQPIQDTATFSCP